MLQCSPSANSNCHINTISINSSSATIAIVAANCMYTSFSLDVGNEATFRHFIAHTEADHPGFGVATVHCLPSYGKGKFNFFQFIRYKIRAAQVSA